MRAEETLSARCDRAAGHTRRPSAEAWRERDCCARPGYRGGSRFGTCKAPGRARMLVDEITKEKQRVSETLARVDAQREKLTGQLSELEATERVLTRSKRHPSSRTGENPPYGMIGGIEETSASFEARSAPRSYPTAGGARNGHPYRDPRPLAEAKKSARETGQYLGSGKSRSR